MRNEQIQIDQLPGWELVGKGIEHIRKGNMESIEAILVQMAMPRLKAHQDILKIPQFSRPEYPLNIALYEKLHDHGKSAHARYNALRKRVLKFCNALDQLHRHIISDIPR